MLFPKFNKRKISNDNQKLSSTEQEIFSLGNEILSVAKKNPDPKSLKDKLSEWAMQDPSFKVQLFRFIDTYPTLQHDPNLVYQVLMEYLSQPDVNIPKGFGAILKAGKMAKGFVNKQLHENIEAMANRFIAGVDANDALPHLHKRWQQGIAVSADLLGEFCVSSDEAKIYNERYMDLLVNLSDKMKQWQSQQILENDHLGEISRTNISIKLSSLVDKYTPLNVSASVDRCFKQLKPLLEQAAKRNILVNFDVEQSSIKDLNMEVFKRCCQEIDFPAGLAMQAYLESGVDDAKKIIEWSKANNRQIVVRLVKGAYWDYEVIHAQENGWQVPVWTRKSDSDICFEKMAELFINETPTSKNQGGVKLALGSHNLRSIAAVMNMLKKANLPKSAIEMQFLYGMGHGLKMAIKEQGYRVREYVPIGEMIPGMAYLVRRLLENTSNESWLLQGMNTNSDAKKLLASPKQNQQQDFSQKKNFQVSQDGKGHPELANGKSFQNEPFRDFSQKYQWQTFYQELKKTKLEQTPKEIDELQASEAIEKASESFIEWRQKSVLERSKILLATAEKMRQQRDALSAIIIKEASKPWQEADADVCEAIDFLEYYARKAMELLTTKRISQFLGEIHTQRQQGRGVTAVISPWNFPLAICTGLTSAPLVAGNSVVVKPAEQTPIIAKKMCQLFWESGVPKDVLHFLPSKGTSIGKYLVQHPKVVNIAFTGSKKVGLNIWEEAGKLREKQSQLKRVICEMGGKNAIIVDSSADLDEAVLQSRYSAFGFSGQKCSACSRLIVVKDVYETFVRRFVASSQSLLVGDAKLPDVDMAQVIDKKAAEKIRHYINLGKSSAETLLADEKPYQDIENKSLFGPHIFAVDKEDHPLLHEEVFGPVVAIYKVEDFENALRVANQIEYALTGAVFSRTPSHIEMAQAQFQVGNLYINRGCTGALVARHPFGGFKMSGGGSKAGGSDYLFNFTDPISCAENSTRRGFSPETV